MQPSVSLGAIEASRIAPHLWQGSCPPEGNTLARAGFDKLVLCAEEHQPDSERFPGLPLLWRCPLDDGKLDLGQLRRAFEAADSVARSLRRGERVLVTCAEGRNRSGLVVALALHRCFGVPGGVAARRVREHRRARRGPALSNPDFWALLHRLPGRA